MSKNVANKSSSFNWVRTYTVSSTGFEELLNDVRKMYNIKEGVPISISSIKNPYQTENNKDGTVVNFDDGTCWGVKSFRVDWANTVVVFQGTPVNKDLFTAGLISGLYITCDAGLGIDLCIRPIETYLKSTPLQHNLFVDEWSFMGKSDLENHLRTCFGEGVKIDYVYNGVPVYIDYLPTVLNIQERFNNDKTPVFKLMVDAAKSTVFYDAEQNVNSVTVHCPNIVVYGSNELNTLFTMPKTISV